MTMTYGDAMVGAARRQMPTLMSDFGDALGEYLSQTGGWVMAFRRDIPWGGGAHVMLTEDVAPDGGTVFYVFGYADDDCEGHLVVATPSASNAVWWFRAWARPTTVCPCEGFGGGGW